MKRTLNDDETNNDKRVPSTDLEKKLVEIIRYKKKLSTVIYLTFLQFKKKF